MFPVRCYTCNTVLAQHWKECKDYKVNNRPLLTFFEHKHVSRICCRRMFLGHVDLIVEQMDFPNVDVVMDDSGTTLKREVRSSREVSCA